MPLEVGSVEARLSLSTEAFTRGLDAAHQKLMQSAARFGQARPADAVVANMERLTETISFQERQFAIMEEELGRVASKYGETSLQVQKKQLALDRLSASIERNEEKLRSLADGVDDARGGFDGLTQVLIGAARHIGEMGVEMAANALAGLVDMTAQAGAAGIEYNSTLQQTEAQLRALTGSAAGAQEVMALIKQEADQVPSVPLQDLARAATSLQPATKMANASLEELLDTAELLAASNPEEGISGASFALREAVSGDYTSLIERFNMPRAAINKLKEEGVPALEIVQRSMADLGITSDLLAEQSNTLSGRWVAFQGALLKVAGAATGESFEALNEALGEMLGRVQENGPAIEAWAKEFGSSLARIVVSGADIAEKIPWEIIGLGLSKGAEGAAFLAESLETAYVAGAQLVTLYGGLVGMADAILSGEDATQGWERGITNVGTSFRLLGEEQAASTDHMKAMASEIQKVEASATALGRALPKLKPEDGMNAGDLRAHQLKLLEEEADARESLADKQAALNAKAAESERKYAADVVAARTQLTKAHEEYAASVASAEAERASAVEALEAQHQDTLASIRQERVGSEEALRQGRLAAEAEYRAAVEELERAHGEKLADLGRDLSRKMEDYDRDREQRAAELGQKLEDIERGHADRVEALLGQREGIEQDAADKRLGIEAKLKEQLASLEEKHRERIAKIKEGVSEIEGKISGNAWALIKNGRRNVEDFLKGEDRKRYQQLQKQLADEQAEHEKQRQALTDEAESALEANASQEATKLAQVEERLAKEKEAHERAVTEANERYTLDAENRRMAHERAVTDLETRIARENEGHARQAEELKAKRDAELADVQAKHEATLAKLAERFGKEQAAYDAQRATIQAKHATERADIEASYQERKQVVETKLSEMRAAHQAAQQDIRQQLYDTSVAHRQRMQELAEQWNGPISQVERYRQLMAESGLGGGGAVPDALRGALAGANKPGGRATDSITKRALGGPLGAGELALVGEQGPELFMSQQAGSVLNALQTRALLGNIAPAMPAAQARGGGPVTVHIDMSGMTVTSQADEQRLVDKLTGRLEGIFMGGSTQQEVGGTRLIHGGRVR
jgi:hypothetical protein